MDKELLKDSINEFNKSLENIKSEYFISTNGKIYKIIDKDIVYDKDMNIDNTEEYLVMIKNKLGISTSIEEQDISEYQTGADKILEPNKENYGLKLTIKADNSIFYEYQGCIDDFKYGSSNAKENLKKIIEIKKNVYERILINSFTKIYQNKIKELGVSTPLIPSPQINIPQVVYGGKK